MEVGGPPRSKSTSADSISIPSSVDRNSNNNYRNRSASVGCVWCWDKGGRSQRTQQVEGVYDSREDERGVTWVAASIETQSKNLAKSLLASGCILVGQSKASFHI